MASFPIGEGDDLAKKMTELFGPAQIDHMVRQANQFCWMGLPKERRSIDEVESQIRRIVERALSDFREDRVAFGTSGDA
ncbi:MAG: hypothetical protein JWN86_3853 [Planctomycetota bacterium]|nr:hypothetical protein [Planctomycetota bacterium]